MILLPPLKGFQNAFPNFLGVFLPPSPGRGRVGGRRFLSSSRSSLCTFKCTATQTFTQRLPFRGGSWARHERKGEFRRVSPNGSVGNTAHLRCRSVTQERKHRCGSGFIADGRGAGGGGCWPRVPVDGVAEPAGEPAALQHRRHPHRRLQLPLPRPHPLPHGVAKGLLFPRSFKRLPGMCKRRDDGQRCSVSR